MAKLDPIYFVLAAHDEGRKYYERSCLIEGDEICENSISAMERLIDHFRKVLEVRPTTEAGLLAKLACICTFREEYPDAILDDMDLLSGLAVAA